MTSCQKLSPCESYDMRFPFRVFAPKKSFWSPPCSIRSFIQLRNWKNFIFGAGTSNCIFDRSKPCLEWMSCAASPPGWFSKNWRCIGSLHFADAIYAAHRKPRKQAQLFDALLRTIASDLVPLRPQRSEPRARKRRPKNYQLLTKPRKEMRIAPHRNKPKNQS